MSAVLNVVGGPESFCGRMVALVEECVEHLQDYGLLLVGFGLRHLDLSAFARPSLYPPLTGLVIASTPPSTGILAPVIQRAAFAQPKQGPNFVLRPQKHIRVENGLIALRGNIGSRTGSAHSASIVDGNVEATKTSDGLVDEVLDFLFMPHIGVHKFGLGPEFAQFLGLFLTFIVVSVRSMTRTPSRATGQGCGATDTCRCAGY